MSAKNPAKATDDRLAMDEALRKAASQLATEEERRAFSAAVGNDLGQDPIEVFLPEMGNPEFAPDPERSRDDTCAFKVTLRPTGNMVKYSIPRAALNLWKARNG